MVRISLFDRMFVCLLARHQHSIFVGGRTVEKWIFVRLLGMTPLSANMGYHCELRVEIADQFTVR